MRRAKKAQSAALLIGIISALIVIYIIFLPSEDRLKMIDEEGEFGSITESGRILLEAEEIVMEHISKDEIDHDLPAVNLYTSTSAKILVEENTIYVKKAWFDEETYEKEFTINNLKNSDNVLISFAVMKSKGKLSVVFNDREIFSNEITGVNVEPIKISNDILKEENVIKLTVSGVGAAFWSTNEFLLTSFKITTDVTDTSTQEASLKFIVGSEEARNVEMAKIRFVPECQTGNVGVLTILVNNNEIFSSVPDCGVPRPIQFSPVHIIEGENKLAFRTPKGRYLIDNVKITTELKETPSYLYYFDISKDDLDDIISGSLDVNMTVFFTDDRKDKEAEIAINGKKMYMTRHDEAEWSVTLNNYVEEGSNALKIIPEERLEIRRMIVELSES